jgi:hypothetical protein
MPAEHRLKYTFSTGSASPAHSGSHQHEDEGIEMRKPIWIAGVALGAAGAAVAGGVAVASNGDDSPLSHQYTQEQADAATKAALKATGGGTANSVETDDENGATYEVEVTKADGTTVDVRLDENYGVVVIEDDSEEPGSE